MKVDQKENLKRMLEILTQIEAAQTNNCMRDNNITVLGEELEVLGNKKYNLSLEFINAIPENKSFMKNERTLDSFKNSAMQELSYLTSYPVFRLNFSMLRHLIREDGLYGPEIWDHSYQKNIYGYLHV